MKFPWRIWVNSTSIKTKQNQTNRTLCLFPGVCGSVCTFEIVEGCVHYNGYISYQIGLRNRYFISYLQSKLVLMMNGMAWHGMAWYCMVWYGMVWYSMAWYGIVWYGTVWYGTVWYGMVWHGMVWYGMVWYGMVWYGMVWYGMVWHGMVRYGMMFVCRYVPSYSIDGVLNSFLWNNNTRDRMPSTKSLTHWGRDKMAAVSQTTL